VTRDQRETFVQHVGNGAKFGEAAGLVGVRPADLESYWTAGVRGTDENATGFVSEIRAARARYLATTRAKAAAAAGTRESPDLLAVAREVESDFEPVAESRDRGPTLEDLLHDADEGVREAAREAHDACRGVVTALADRDRRARERGRERERLLEARKARSPASGKPALGTRPSLKRKSADAASYENVGKAHPPLAG
jgi:hypothetical protein